MAYLIKSTPSALNRLKTRLDYLHKYQDGELPVSERNKRATDPRRKQRLSILEHSQED